MAASRTKKPGKLSVNQVASLITARASKIKGDPLQFAASQELLSFGVDSLIYLNAPPKACDMLMREILTSTFGAGSKEAIKLAPRTSSAMQERVFKQMIGPLQIEDIDCVIKYAKEVLGRKMTPRELERVALWFRDANCNTLRKGREKFLAYVKDHRPEKLREFEEYFTKEQAFWDTFGGVI